MLLVASETGHVYTFATRKLQPMITSDAGKALIQTCLNSPDPPGMQPGGPTCPTGQPPSVSGGVGSADQRMSATGYEETELTYNVAAAAAAADEEQQQKVRQMMYNSHAAAAAAAHAHHAAAAAHAYHSPATAAALFSSAASPYVVPPTTGSPVETSYVSSHSPPYMGQR